VSAASQIVGNVRSGRSSAAIAATADVVGAELVTLNVKHFPMLKGLKPAF
jgi:predicted nucleic acid-binding protein